MPSTKEMVISTMESYLYEKMDSTESGDTVTKEFSFGDAVKDGPLTLGLHKKGSFHDIVDAEGCQIVHPDYSTVLACVREYAKENNIPYYHKRDHQGVLRHLLVRRAEVSGDMLVALVTSTQQEIDL